MLVEELLTEKLGNLSKLNVGSLINVLKQTGSKGKRGYNTSPTGKRFGGGYASDVSSTSDVVDVGPIKNGIAGLRKAYKDHDTAKAFALYVGGKPVAFGKFSGYDLGGASRTGMLAYDLSQFKDQVEAKYADELAQAKKEKNTWKINNIEHEIERESGKSFHVKKERNWSYHGDDESKKYQDEHYHGKLHDTSSLAEFLKNVFALAGDKTVTAKLVLSDTTAGKKRTARWGNKPEPRALDVHTALDDLKTRLKKYKLTKKPTAASVKDFMKMLGSNLDAVSIGGRTFKTKGGESAYSKASALNVLNGKPFDVQYDAAEPSKYDHLSIKYVFNPETGILAPYGASWSDENGKSQHEVLDSEQFMKHEVGVKDTSKDTVMTKVLTALKNSPHSAQELINKSRKAGHDHPEFAAIEKSIAASKA